MNTFQPSLSFYDTHDKRYYPDIWDRLDAGMWRDYDIDKGVQIRKGVLDNGYLFPTIIPIFPGLCLDEKNLQLVEDIYYPSIIEASKQTFFATVERFFAQFEGQKIGVHLSGGLDSSLIIGLLSFFNIPFVAIGLASDRYEFRTERVVQEKILESVPEGALLNIDDYPFYSQLSSIPRHQLPDTYIKMHSANSALALEFANRGVTTVFTGQGGDTIFVDAVDDDKINGYNIGNDFLIPWEQDIIYSPLGLNLVSPYANTEIIDQIHSLRIGQPVDPRKLWCRHFFHEILPRELSTFSYVANFFGYSTSGLVDSKEEIMNLLEEAQNYTSHPFFSGDSIASIEKADLNNLDFNSYSLLCEKLSVAVWYHSLFRNEGSVCIYAG